LYFELFVNIFCFKMKKEKVIKQIQFGPFGKIDCLICTKLC
jgi:hypothetical protein